MISECLNPACRRELRYLRDGRVVRVVHGLPAQVSVEHFWLCGDCYLNYNFKLSVDGEVTLSRRVETPAPPEAAFAFTLVA
jgi:hypothetical protein